MPVIRACDVCGQMNRIPAAHLADTGRCGKCKSPLVAVARPIDADAELFDDIVQQARVPVVVDFWAAWCGPCRMAAPEVSRAASNMAGRAIVLKVDTEAYPGLAARFNVRGIPNFLVLLDGRPVRQQAGVVDHQQIESWVKEAAAGPATAA
jgi:thioredoxin 2